jgi:hypothetical protein
VLTILGGLVVSMIVLLLQVLLQPGQPVRDGGAAPAEASGAVALAIPEDGGWASVGLKAHPRVGVTGPRSWHRESALSADVSARAQEYVGVES